MSNLTVFPHLPTSIHYFHEQKKSKNENQKTNNENEETKKSMIELPLEMWNEIIKYCDGRTINELSKTNKTIRNLCDKENEKYKALYFDEYTPINKKFRKEIEKSSMYTFKSISANTPLTYKHRSNQFSYFDPYYNHPYCWKDMYDLQMKLNRSRINPVRELKRVSDYFHEPMVNPHLCEFFRINRTDYQLKLNNDNDDDDDDKEENDENDIDDDDDNDDDDNDDDDDEQGKYYQFDSDVDDEDENIKLLKKKNHYCEERRKLSEVEMLMIGRNLKPVRLLVRCGYHPSYMLTSLKLLERGQEEGEEDEEEDRNWKRVYESLKIEVKSQNGDDDNEEQKNKKRKRNAAFKTNYIELNSNDDQPIKLRKLTDDQYVKLNSTSNDNDDGDDHNNNNDMDNNEENEETVYSKLSDLYLKRSKLLEMNVPNREYMNSLDHGDISEFPLFDNLKINESQSIYPECPCCEDDIVAFEVFIWNFKKEKYELLTRSATCRSADEFTFYESPKSNLLLNSLFALQESEIQELKDEKKRKNERFPSSISKYHTYIDEFALLTLSFSGISITEDDWVTGS